MACNVQQSIDIEVGKISLATLIAFTALVFTAGWKIDPENQANGKPWFLVPVPCGC